MLRLKQRAPAQTEALRLVYLKFYFLATFLTGFFAALALVGLAVKTMSPMIALSKPTNWAMMIQPEVATPWPLRIRASETAGLAWAPLWVKLAAENTQTATANGTRFPHLVAIRNANKKTKPPVATHSPSKIEMSGVEPMFRGRIALPQSCIPMKVPKNAPPIWATT